MILARRGLALGLVAALGGCKLIDQRTFNPNAGKPPVIPPPPAPPAPPPPKPIGPPPLVTIPLGSTDYEGPLHDAIAQALARARRDFDVRVSVPATGTPESQAAAVDAANPVAARVAQLISAQGGRAILSAQVDAALKGTEILVFVR